MADGMVIVGAGECGGRAALTLRDLGYEGRITLIGDEPHHPYERPPLSKDVLTADEVLPPKWVGAPDRFAELNIDCIHEKTAVAIDRQAKAVRLSDGSQLPYDKLLLATGAVPRRLPLAPQPSRRVAYLRNYADAMLIRAHLKPGSYIAIIGGGFIGLELAASARRRGADVTVIEAQPRILMRGVPEPIAQVIAERHVAEGVTLTCGRGLKGIVEEPGKVVIELTDGEAISADCVVIGIGAQPVTGLAESTGLALDNGIVVDATLTTSDPDILAAGDCCSFPLAIYGGRRVRLESWRNAQEQGTLAAKNMLGAGEAISSVPWFWSDQHELTLQVAGLAEGATTTVRRDLGGGAFILFHLADDGRLLSASGLGTGNAVARDIRLAEMLIAKGARPAPEQLAQPEVKLKALLAA
jgi:3-phenylpropionate/trans-cinnamate dioxygenase ferredoxin reductase component